MPAIITNCRMPTLWLWWTQPITTALPYPKSSLFALARHMGARHDSSDNPDNPKIAYPGLIPFSRFSAPFPSRILGRPEWGFPLPQVGWKFQPNSDWCTYLMPLPTPRWCMLAWLEISAVEASLPDRPSRQTRPWLADRSFDDFCHPALSPPKDAQFEDRITKSRHAYGLSCWSGFGSCFGCWT